MRRRVLCCCWLVACAATLVLASIAPKAGATPPVQHEHFAFTCTATPSPPTPCFGDGPFGQTEIDPDLCDISGSKTDSQAANLQLFADGTEKIEFKETYDFTSALTGKSIESRSDSQQTFNTVPIDDGTTTTFFFALKGVEQQLKLPNGSVIALDAGAVIFTFTIDDATGQGSLSISESGHHADLNNNLCNYAVPALS